MPKTHIFRVIRKGEVRVNGKRAKPDQRLLASDIVRVPPVRTGAAAPPRRAPPRWCRASIGAIVYEDPRLLVIDKPAGVAVHGGSGVSFGVIEGLRAARPDETLELVHRIDRDTSGLLMISRKPAALRTLHALMRDGKVEKRYLALVKGKWELGRKRIDVPLRTDIRVGGERTVKAHESGQGSGERLQAGAVLRQEGFARGSRRSRPAARTRSACMPRMPAIRWRAMRNTAKTNSTRR